jgi:hypothetical protein
MAAAAALLLAHLQPKSSLRQQPSNGPVSVSPWKAGRASGAEGLLMRFVGLGVAREGSRIALGSALLRCPDRMAADRRPTF